MHISTRWLNTYVQPGDLSPAQIEHALIDAGFEIESSLPLPSGDTRLDVAITSNRGDALSIAGLAREVAAKTGRAFRMPPPAGRDGREPRAAATNVSEAITLENRVHDACPLFTLRVIRGVKVGPSPAWLMEALESVGQRSINNVVDVTNFINFELGNPCHVFDLRRLEPAPGSSVPALIVRTAHEGEKLLTLDGKARVLSSGDIVVADGRRAQGLAGIMGGGESEVSPATVDVALEVATWDPVRVRATARRLQIRTDASHRYERVVDARTLDHAARRALALLVEVAGGEPLTGALSAGRAPEPATVVTLRPSRVARVLGVDVPRSVILSILARLEIGIETSSAGADDPVRCTIPVFRPDLTREIDLIEEIARQHGLDKIAIADRLPVRVARPQSRVRARREIGSVLAGLGFFEAVTFSFTSPARGDLFREAGLESVSVDDERRGGEPTLRPSVLTGLLASRRANQDAQVHPPGGVRLFETASVFAQRQQTSVERRVLGLLIDVPTAAKDPSGVTLAEKQMGFRHLRGAIESLVRALGGTSAARALRFNPASAQARAYDPNAFAHVTLEAAARDAADPNAAVQILGVAGLLSAEATTEFGLHIPLAAAELSLDALVGLFPPRAGVTPLPSFPSVERDLSPIVSENVSWEQISAVVDRVRASAARIESCAFLGTYRGKQIGEGRKSVTLRVTFRDPDKTLRHEEVDPEIGAIAERLRTDVQAEFRTA